MKKRVNKKINEIPGTGKGGGGEREREGGGEGGGWISHPAGLNVRNCGVIGAPGRRRRQDRGGGGGEGEGGGGGRGG